MADLEKSDKLGDVNMTLDEGSAPYYSDVFTPGEIKEQLEVGKEVKQDTEAVRIATRPVTGDSLKTSSGTQAITGIGFTPSLIIFNANDQGGKCMSIGQSAPSYYWTNYMSPTATWAWTTRTDYAVFLDDNGGNVMRCTVSSFDADGFTLSWTLTGTKTAIFSYICFP